MKEYTISHSHTLKMRIFAYLEIWRYCSLAFLLTKATELNLCSKSCGGREDSGINHKFYGIKYDKISEESDTFQEYERKTDNLGWQMDSSKTNEKLMHGSKIISLEQYVKCFQIIVLSLCFTTLEFPKYFYPVQRCGLVANIIWQGKKGMFHF